MVLKCYRCKVTSEREYNRNKKNEVKVYWKVGRLIIWTTILIDVVEQVIEGN